ncbi:hypothetical protein HAX54_039753 [Datura stramonium]|uniref:Uncharacterized protein n=1 Tax=Datura stramonium TaxID=4076 RepID=A0ABS8VNJ9_DATST|nr:hypothetical protein [Datura stramonium]
MEAAKQFDNEEEEERGKEIVRRKSVAVVLRREEAGSVVVAGGVRVYGGVYRLREMREEKEDEGEALGLFWPESDSSPSKHFRNNGEPMKKREEIVRVVRR